MSSATQRFLRTHLLTLTMATLLLPAHANSGDEFQERGVIGQWKLVSVLDFAGIASPDKAEAQRLVGKVLTISATMVQVDREVCDAPNFWAERVVPAPHIEEKLHTGAARLRLPNPATLVELGCTDVYVRTPDQLVLLWGGALFDAVRIDGKRQAKPKSQPAPGAAAVAGNARKGPRKPAPAPERPDDANGQSFGLIF